MFMGRQMKEKLAGNMFKHWTYPYVQCILMMHVRDYAWNEKDQLFACNS
jgi:hypothetical protein